MKKANRINQKMAQMRDKEIERYRVQFSEIGVNTFPEFTSPEEYAMQFRRCSVLQSDNVVYSTSASATGKKERV